MSKTSILFYISIGLALGSVITKYRIEAQLEEYAVTVKQGIVTAYHAGRQAGALDCASDGYAIVATSDDEDALDDEVVVVCNGVTEEEPKKYTIPEDSAKSLSI